MASAAAPPPNRTPLPSPAARQTAAARPHGAPAVPSPQRFAQLPPDDEDDMEAVRVSHVRILPTSVPYVHDQLMEQREREQKARAADHDRWLEERAQARADNPDDPSQSAFDDQEATARALKPHSRSIVDLDKLRFEPPQAHYTAHIPKRSRKWQFGIRSRNQPYEAMLYLYRAIDAQGGVWDIQPGETGKLRTIVFTYVLHEANCSTGGDIGPDESSKPLQTKYPHLPSDYYVPKDPWFIRARLLKEGIKAPGPSPNVHGRSTSTSSKSDVEELRRRFNITNISSSTDDKNSLPKDPNASASSSVSQHQSTGRIHGVWVFVDIQLYQLEENSYMVDFKCDGYQNVLRNEGDTEWHPISRRFRNKEKEVTSPYPFLDVASDLVAQLAVAS